MQVKCPLLTTARVAEAASRGRDVATDDTYESMGLSRGASALGVALALERGAAQPPCRTRRSGGTSPSGRGGPAPRPGWS